MPEQAGGWVGVLVDAHAGTVQAHRLLWQGVDAQPVGQQRLVYRGLIVGAAEHGKHVGQSIVGQVRVAQLDAQQGIKGVRAAGRPVAHRDQAMVAFHQELAQPDADHRAYTDALPVAVRANLGIDPLPDAHLFHQAQQQGQVIDLFGRDLQSLGHAVTLPPHAPPANFAPIYANGQ
jgi:hypothetical protein